MRVRKMLLVVTAGAVLLAGALSASAAEVKSSFLMNFDFYSASSSNDTVAKHEFLVRRARAYFSTDLNDQVSGEIGLQADDNGTTGARTSTLKDFYVDFRFAPMALVRVGMYKYEFDLSGRESATINPFMDRAIVTTAVAGSLTGASGDFRDKGVSVIGKSSIVGYGVGLWQGQGSNANDNNNKYGYTANVWGKLAALKLNLGYMNSDNTPLGGATDKYAAGVAGIAFDTDAVLLQAEYYRARRRIPATQDLKGYYVMGSYTVAKDIDVMARYQLFEDEQWGMTSNKITSSDFGVKYYLARKGRGGSNISLDYMFRSADDGVTQRLFDERGQNVTGSEAGNVLMARLQLQF